LLITIRPVPLIEKAETYPAPTDAEASPRGWRPAEGFERTASTALADIVTGLATALLLLAAYAFFGREMNWLKGLHWGLGAFAALTLWPNMGLPPYLPGQAMPPHLDRQIWWAVTAVMAVGGLLLLLFAQKVLPVIAGLLLLVLPQIFGAPVPKSYNSAIPESVAHQFFVASVLTDLLFWLSLGALTGFLYESFALDVSTDPQAKAAKAA
jgi:cobalt transporter subunit CbtA